MDQAEALPSCGHCGSQTGVKKYRYSRWSVDRFAFVCDGCLPVVRKTHDLEPAL